MTTRKRFTDKSAFGAGSGTCNSHRLAHYLPETVLHLGLIGLAVAIIWLSTWMLRNIPHENADRTAARGPATGVISGLFSHVPRKSSAPKVRKAVGSTRVALSYPEAPGGAATPDKGPDRTRQLVVELKRGRTPTTASARSSAVWASSRRLYENPAAVQQGDTRSPNSTGSPSGPDYSARSVPRLHGVMIHERPPERYRLAC
ncbi:hypothetical protein J2W14_003263 [Pseudarthrobacter oxydans]|nr:hypothetical protein [Pseudarthrobacter oxydans]